MIWRVAFGKFLRAQSFSEVIDIDPGVAAEVAGREEAAATVLGVLHAHPTVDAGLFPQ